MRAKHAFKKGDRVRVTTKTKLKKGDRVRLTKWVLHALVDNGIHHGGVGKVIDVPATDLSPLVRVRFPGRPKSSLWPTDMLELA